GPRPARPRGRRAAGVPRPRGGRPRRLRARDALVLPRVAPRRAGDRGRGAPRHHLRPAGLRRVGAPARPRHVGRRADGAARRAARRARDRAAQPDHPRHRRRDRPADRRHAPRAGAAIDAHRHGQLRLVAVGDLAGDHPHAARELRGHAHRGLRGDARPPAGDDRRRPGADAGRRARRLPRPAPHGAGTGVVLRAPGAALRLAVHRGDHRAARRDRGAGAHPLGRAGPVAAHELRATPRRRHPARRARRRARYGPLPHGGRPGARHPRGARLPGDEPAL
ncbi:MAG: Putative oxidoreductase, partial [uncultured Actinomycetospora sp.]